MITSQANAKVNLMLHTAGRRADGYHLLSMLMHSVSLADTLTLQPASQFTLTVTQDQDLPGYRLAGVGDEHNIVLRAARALAAACGVTQGAAMQLHKRIPAGAGLGGGSADAAAALLGLQALWGVQLPQDQFRALALSLGADLPYCLVGGFAHVTGIGEQICQLPALPAWPMLLAMPQQPLSTAAVFKAHTLPQHGVDAQTAVILGQQAAAQAAHNGAPCTPTGADRAFLAACGNDLTPTAMAACPQLQPLLGALQPISLACGMSGTGSAVWAVFETTQQRDRAVAQLPGWVRPITPVDCGVLF